MLYLLLLLKVKLYFYFESLSTTLDYCYWLILSVKRENNIVRRNYIRYTFSDRALRVSCEKEASRDKIKYNTENKYFYKYQLPLRIGIKRYQNFRHVVMSHYYNRMIQQSDRIIPFGKQVKRKWTFTVYFSSVRMYVHNIQRQGFKAVTVYQLVYQTVLNFEDASRPSGFDILCQSY